jgi:hypothetical protein
MRRVPLAKLRSFFFVQRFRDAPHTVAAAVVVDALTRRRLCEFVDTSG